MTANPSQGVRITRPAARPIRRTEAGRIALPLTVHQDGEHIGSGDLVLTQDQATALYLELGQQLGATPPQPINSCEADPT